MYLCFRQVFIDWRSGPFTGNIGLNAAIALQTPLEATGRPTDLPPLWGEPG